MIDFAPLLVVAAVALVGILDPDWVHIVHPAVWIVFVNVVFWTVAWFTFLQ